MSLSKQQMVGVASGGVFVVVAGLIGYMLFDAATARSEAEESLADAMARFNQHNEAPIYPSDKSIADVKSNETSYAEWRQSAVSLVARGDMPPPAEEEPSVFKQRLQNEVRRLCGLPGGNAGHLAAPDFLFGFEQYLGESGVLPQASDVPRLAIQLAAISRTVDLFAEAGVQEVKAVRRIDPPAVDDSRQQDKKKSGSKKKKTAAEEKAPKETCHEYAFELLARPAAVVQVLNRLATDVRFCVVKDFSMKESADMIVNNLTAKESAESKAAQPAASSSRRRRRASAPALGDAGEGEEKKVGRLVVDPELDAPIQMAFTLEVHDFGQGQAAAPAEAPAKDAAAEKPSEKPLEKKEAN